MPFRDSDPQFQLSGEHSSLLSSFSYPLIRSPEDITECDESVARLITIRHFPTFNNLVGLMQTDDNRAVWSDVIPELSERTILRRGLYTIPRPDRIVISPFRRTEKTVMMLAQRNGWPVDSAEIVADPRLVERNQGRLGGLNSYRQALTLLEDYPESVALYLERKGIQIPVEEFLFQNKPFMKLKADIGAIIDDPDFSVDDGESLRDVIKRVLPVYLEYALKPGTTLFCTHGGVMKAMRMDSTTFSSLGSYRDLNGKHFLAEF